MGFVWDKLVKNLKRLKNGGIDDVARKLIVSNKKEVTDLNTKKQLFDKGINSDGTEVEPEYKKTTISIKERKGQPTNRVTLKDTGSFHKKFYVDSKKKSFTLDSKDSKRDDLVDKYGERIFGLTQKSRSSLSRTLKKDLVKRVKNKL